MQSITGIQDVSGTPTYYNSTPQFQGVVVGLSVPIFAGSSIARAKTEKTNIEREQKNADYINQQFKSHLEQQSEQLVTYASLIDYYKKISDYK